MESGHASKDKNEKEAKNTRKLIYDHKATFKSHVRAKKLENFTNKITEAKRESLLLKKNGEAIAREKYFMSKKGEDVFIISEE